MMHNGEQNSTVPAAAGRVVGLLVLAGVCLAVMMPVLHDAHFGILDTPYNYAYAKQMSLWHPATYLTIPKFGGRVAPGLPAYFFPAQFVTSATLHFLYKTIVFLYLPLAVVFLQLRQITGRTWYALLAAIACLGTIAFAENYYTLFKGEPCILAGTLVNTFLLWHMLSNRSRRSFAERCATVAAAMLCVVFIYWIKETGIAYLAAYIAGLLLFAWAWHRRPADVVRRAGWLTVVNMAAAAVVLVGYYRLHQAYNVPGGASYSLTLTGIGQGLIRMGAFVGETAPQLYLVIGALAVAWIAYPRLMTHAGNLQAVRLKFAAATWYAVYAVCMYLIYVPWTEIAALYMLPANIGAIVAAFLVADVWWCIGGILVTRHARGACAVGAGALLVLTLSHGVYSVLVSPVSEGRVRCRFDQAYGKMFRYIAAHTPPNGVAYFMMDSLWPEPRYNAEYSMAVLYGRPDVRCRFPMIATEMREPGLIAVTDYAVPMNYDRMPLQHAANAQFDISMKPRIALDLVFEAIDATPVWFVAETYHGPQYASRFGYPAFWSLKRGAYRFGWKVYRAAMTNELQATSSSISNERPQSAKNVVVSGAFAEGLSGWSLWESSRNNTNWVRCVGAADGTTTTAVWIENPNGALAGVQQVVPVVSGAVYRLSGSARCRAPLAAHGMFGGRIGLFMPPASEECILWPFDTEARQWSDKSVTFTNTVTGNAVVFVHLGYGKIATSGEFTNIRLERIEPMEDSHSITPSSAPSIVRTTLSGKTFGHTSVWDAVRNAGNGDQIIVAGGTYHEALCFAGHPLNPGLDGLRVIGMGKPVISVELTDVPTMNECAAEFSGMRHLLLSNVVVKAVCTANNLLNVYNTLFNNCTDANVIDCAFVSAVHGTNNIFKSFVATQGATGIIMRDSAIVTCDMTGSNSVYHTATHDAEPSVFQHVWFLGHAIQDYRVGEVMLDTCFANDRHFRTAGTMMAGVRGDAMRVVPPAFTALVDMLQFEEDRNVLKSSAFFGPTPAWRLWIPARGGDTQALARGVTVGDGILRIANIGGASVGMQQSVQLVSGVVYRLEGVARSVITNASDVMFGGRIAVFLQPQDEQQLVWMSEYNNWWPKSLVFTNQVTGIAVVYAHMGYGNVASTGEFTDIRLERVE